jgi:hypothetical protein
VGKLIAGVSILLSIGMALTGCGGGSQSASPTVVARTVSGVAATGAPLSGTVYLKDSSSLPELSAPIAADGSFTLHVDGYTAPFIVKAEGTANGSAYTLYSFAAADGIANVNPLSNLAVAQASGSGDLATLYAAPDPAKMQAIKTVLPDAISNVQTAFAAQLTQVGAATANFISDPYAADHQGLDLMFDKVDISVTNALVAVGYKNNGTVSISSLAQLQVNIDNSYAPLYLNSIVTDVTGPVGAIATMGAITPIVGIDPTNDNSSPAPFPSPFPDGTSGYVVIVGGTTFQTTILPDFNAMTNGGRLTISSLRLYGNASLNIAETIAVANIQLYDNSTLNILAPLTLSSIQTYGNSAIYFGAETTIINSTGSVAIEGGAAIRGASTIGVSGATRNGGSNIISGATVATAVTITSITAHR